MDFDGFHWISMELRLVSAVLVLVRGGTWKCWYNKLLKPAARRRSQVGGAMVRKRWTCAFDAWCGKCVELHSIPCETVLPHGRMRRAHPLPARRSQPQSRCVRGGAAASPRAALEVHAGAGRVPADATQCWSGNWVEWGGGGGGWAGWGWVELAWMGGGWVG